jgi:hypothetical protein
MTRRYHTPAIAYLIDGWDGGDPWGSAMSAGWAVAEVARAAAVPGVDSALEISWGCGPVIDLGEAADSLDDRDDNGDVSFETAILSAAYLSGDVTDDDLLFAARVLSRYLDLCKSAGLDY